MSDHVLVLSHVVGFALGLAFVASVLRRLVRGKGVRVRTEDAPPRRRPMHSLGRLVLRGTVRMLVGLALALATPVGLLCANRRYPVVAPVLAPFAARLAALGHRTGRVQCFPLFVWHVWLVRCAGCRQRSLWREVSSPDGTTVELKVLGRSSWRTQRCVADYLTVPPARTTLPATPMRRTRSVRRRTGPVPIGQVRVASPASPTTSPQTQPAVTDKTA